MTSVVNITFSIFRPQWRCLNYKLDDSTCFFRVQIFVYRRNMRCSLSDKHKAITVVSEYMRAEN